MTSQFVLGPPAERKVNLATSCLQLGPITNMASSSDPTGDIALTNVVGNPDSNSVIEKLEHGNLVDGSEGTNVVEVHRCCTNCSAPLPAYQLLRVGTGSSWRWWCNRCHAARRAIEVFCNAVCSYSYNLYQSLMYMWESPNRLAGTTSASVYSPCR